MTYSEQDIYNSKNPLCELCQNRFKLPDENSRLGGGKKLAGGIYLCNACLPSAGILKKYTNLKTGKAHLTDNERMALANSRTVRAGKRNYKTSSNYSI